MCYNLTKHPTASQLFQAPLSEESWNVTDNSTMQPMLWRQRNRWSRYSLLSLLSILGSQTAKEVTTDKKTSPKAKGCTGCQENSVRSDIPAWVDSKNIYIYFSSGTKDHCRNCVYDAGKIESKFKCRQPWIKPRVLFQRCDMNMERFQRR